MTDQVSPTQPYGQQPMPGGGAPGAPVGPGGYIPPGGPPPRKKGLPGWAIALIVGGGVLLIGIIVAVVVVASAFMSARPSEDCSMPGSCGQGLPPVPSEEAPEDPSGSGTSTDSIPLDGSAVFPSPPAWGTPYLSGWDVNIFDQEGVNQFGNNTLGCLFTTSQNVQAVETSSQSDAEQSNDLLNQLTDSISEKASDATVTDMNPVEVGLGLSGSQSIEFAAARVDYSSPSGEYVDVYLARSMQASGSYMFALISCPTTVMDGPESPLDDLLDQISIVVLP